MSFKRIIYSLGIAIVLLFSSGLFAQGNGIAAFVEAQRKTAEFKEVQLFENVLTESSGRWTTVVKQVTEFTIDKNKLESLYNANENSLSFRIPAANENIDVELVKANVVTNDFSPVDAASKQPLNYEYGLHYRGIVKGDKNSLVAISIFNNMVMGMVSTTEGNYVLGALQDEQKNYTGDYVFYKESDLKVSNNFSCSTPDEEGYVNSNKSSEVLSMCIRPIEIYFECDYQLYLDQGSNTNNVVNFVTGMFNAISTLYQNEQIHVAISEIGIWTQADPYRAYATPGLALPVFTNNLADAYKGDLAHLLLRYQNGGGVAYVTGDYAVSDINNTYNNLPAYSWNINVITHEIGHNLGSHHTHWCNWPGGAIDNCETTEGGCAAGPAPTNGGTIMSYCHLRSYGINFSNGFGPLPGAAIRVGYLTHLQDKSIVSTTLPRLNGPNVFNSGNPNYFLYQANSTVNMYTSTFSWPAIVDAKAGTRVRLSNGFRANAGSYFHAYIEECINKGEGPLPEVNTDEQMDFIRTYPNPFASSTTIEFELKEASDAVLEVYDVTGNKIICLLNNVNCSKGKYRFSFDGESLSSGIYLCSLKVGENTYHSKLLLQK